MNIRFHILKPSGRGRNCLPTNFIFHRNQIFSIPDPLITHNFPFLTRFPTPFPRRNPRRDPKFPGGTPLPPRNLPRDPKFPGGTPSPRRNPCGNQNFPGVPLPAQEPAQGPKNPAGPPYMHIQGPPALFFVLGVCAFAWEPAQERPQGAKKSKKTARGGSRPCAWIEVSLYLITSTGWPGPRA